MQSWDDKTAVAKRLKDIGVPGSIGQGHNGSETEVGWTGVSFAIEKTCLEEALSQRSVLCCDGYTGVDRSLTSSYARIRSVCNQVCALHDGFLQIVNGDPKSGKIHEYISRFVASFATSAMVLSVVTQIHYTIHSRNMFLPEENFTCST